MEFKLDESSVRLSYPPQMFSIGQPTFCRDCYSFGHTREECTVGQVCRNCCCCGWGDCDCGRLFRQCFEAVSAFLSDQEKDNEDPSEAVITDPVVGEGEG